MYYAKHFLIVSYNNPGSKYCRPKFTDEASEAWPRYESEVRLRFLFYRIFRSVEKPYVRPHIMIGNSEPIIFLLGPPPFIQVMIY